MLRKLVVRSFFLLKGDAQGGGGSLRAGFLVQGGGDFGKSSLETGNSLYKMESICAESGITEGGVGGEGVRDWGWGI